MVLNIKSVIFLSLMSCGCSLKLVDLKQGNGMSIAVETDVVEYNAVETKQGTGRAIKEETDEDEDEDAVVETTQVQGRKGKKATKKPKKKETKKPKKKETKKPKRKATKKPQRKATKKATKKAAKRAAKKVIKKEAKKATKKEIKKAKKTAAKASATGDPHMINVHGEQFDLWRLGQVELLKIPRNSTPSQAVLRVFAYVTDAGHYTGDDCAEAPYMTTMRVKVKSDINSETQEDIFIKKVGGKMSVFLNQHKSEPAKGPVVLNGGGVVVNVPSETHVKVFVGNASVDVIQPKDPNFYFLNMAATGLESLGLDVGGVLGVDDHTDVATKPAHCRQHTFSRHSPSEADVQNVSSSISASFSGTVGSVAMVR